MIKEPESNRSKQKPAEYLQSVKKIFEKKSAMLLTSFFAGMTALLVLFGVLFFLSEYLERTYNLEGVRKGFALAIPVLFMSVTSFATGLLIKKKVKLMKWLVFTGLALIAGSLSILGMFGANTVLFFVGISLAGVGTGLTLPCLNTIITSSCEAKRRGMVTSLYGSVRFFGVALGPPIFGLLMGYNRNLMFWSAAGLAGVAALLALFLIRVKDMEKPVGTEQKDGQTPEKDGSGVEVVNRPIKTTQPIFQMNPVKKPFSNKNETKQKKR